MIGGLTLIGELAVLRPFVTLGLRDGHMFGPQLGPRVQVGTGAKVIGPVKVGEGARIGINAVVLRDVAAGEVAIGVPAHGTTG